MDPLSITASLIAVIGAANAVGKGLWKLKSIKGAPKELDEVLQEVSDIENSLREVTSIFNDTGNASPSLGPLLDRAKEKLHEVDSFVHSKVVEATGLSKTEIPSATINVQENSVNDDVTQITQRQETQSNGLLSEGYPSIAEVSGHTRKVKRIAWVWHKSRALQLCSQLRLIRHEINSTLLTLTLKSSVSHHSDLMRIHADFATQRADLQTIISMFTPYTRILDELRIQSEASRATSDQLRNLLGLSYFQKMVQNPNWQVEEVELARQRLSGQTNDAEFTQQLSAIGDGASEERSICKPQPGTQSSPASSDSVSAAAPAEQIIAESMAYKAMLPNVQFTSRAEDATEPNVERLLQWTACLSSCPCICHQEIHKRSPQQLSPVIGSYSIHLKGFIITDAKCTITSCRRRSRPSLSMACVLPKWIASRMIMLFMSSMPMNGPELLLKVARVVPNSSKIFQFAQEKNLDGMRNELVAGRATVHDISELTGYSAIFHAIDARNIPMIKFLLQSGVNLNQEDRSGASPVERAWCMVLRTGNMTPEVEHIWKTHFDWDKYSSNKNFSLIHRIIFKTNNMDLAEALTAFPEMINLADSRNQSPVWWAASRNQPDYVKILLDCGADPNICGWGSSPLIGATRARNKIGVELLLNYGANVKWQNWYQDTALMFAAKHTLDTEILDLLLKYGAEINARNIEGRTALIKAAKQGNEVPVKALLNAGAEVDIQDKFGYAALSWAAYHGHHKIVRLLVDHDASLEMVTEEGETILHLLSTSADKGLLEILEEPLIMISARTIQRVDAAGRTAEDRLMERRDLIMASNMDTQEETEEYDLIEAIHLLMGRLRDKIGSQ